jgi:hypothetical protein
MRGKARWGGARESHITFEMRSAENGGIDAAPDNTTRDIRPAMLAPPWSSHMHVSLIWLPILDSPT